MIKFLTIIFILIGSNLIFSNNIITVGTEENDGELIYPSSVKEGLDGNIYVSDSKDYYIKVYTSEGKYLFRMGGKGEGPGQMKRMGDFGFNKNKKLLYFSEFFGGHSWITYMKLNGLFDSVLKLKINVRFGLDKIYYIQGNKFIAEINYIGKIRKREKYFEYTYPKAVVVIDKTGNIIKTVIKKTYIHSISMIEDGADLTIPYIPKFLWVKIDKGIAFTDGLSNELKLIDFNGKEIKKISIPVSLPKRVTDDDLDRWRNKLKEIFKIRNKTWYDRYGKVVNKYKKSIYEYKPVLGEMSMTEKGNILIGSSTESSGKARRFCLLTIDGKMIFSFSKKISDLRVSKHYVFFKTEDEDENVNVNFIRRLGTEQEDLKRLSKAVL